MAIIITLSMAQTDVCTDLIYLFDVADTRQCQEWFYTKMQGLVCAWKLLEVNVSIASKMLLLSPL